MKRLRSAVGLFLAVSFLVSEPWASTDPRGHYFIVEVGATAKGRSASVYRMFRSFYDLENPFTILPEQILDNDPRRQPHVGELRYSLRVANHGGYLFEGPPSREIAVSRERIKWVEDLPVDWFFSHSAEEGRRIYRIKRPDFQAELTDPLTGNLFRGRFEGRFLLLDVLGPGEEARPLLASMKLDLFSEAPVADLASPALARDVTAVRGIPGSSVVTEIRWTGQDDRRPDEFFWLAPEGLEDFVQVYRKFGGGNYARFIADCYFVAHALSSLDTDVGTLRPRLPYLPADGSIDASLKRWRMVERPAEPATVVYQGGPIPLRFLGLRAKRGSNVCAVVSSLKLIEAHDCARGSSSPSESGKADCTVYAPMAVITEWIRDKHGPKGKVSKDEGTDPAEVFSLVEEHGVCAERSYPYLHETVTSDYVNLKGFAQAARKELGSDAQFVDFLPGSCRSEMTRYVEGGRGVRRYDVVQATALPVGQLFAINSVWAGRQQRLFGDTVDAFARAQQDELVTLALNLLSQGRFLVLGLSKSDRYGHAVFAYAIDPEEGAVVVMDSAEPDEERRQRNLIPFDELRETLRMVAFSRDAL